MSRLVAFCRLILHPVSRDIPHLLYTALQHPVACSRWTFGSVVRPVDAVAIDNRRAVLRTTPHFLSCKTSSSSVLILRHDLQPSAFVVPARRRQQAQKTRAGLKKEDTCPTHFCRSPMEVLLAVDLDREQDLRFLDVAARPGQVLVMPNAHA